MQKDISGEYAVQMHGITKMFGSFCALDDVSIDVRKGTIHAMLGENGAGKTTLMNVLYGLYQAEQGDIYLNGEKVHIRNPMVAIRHGIGMVHQHFMLVENFTVTQNIILGNEVTGHFGVINMKKARQEVSRIIERYGLQVDPDAKIEDISVGMQQRVEILKALYRGVDVFILDEPTAVLTPQEIHELIVIMRNLVADGKTVIIITHKLKEIKESSDACTIIRRGKYIDTIKVADVDEAELAEKMVGRAVRLVVDKTPANPGEVALEIRNLNVRDTRGVQSVNDLSLTVRKGEILGIAGVDGNGQKELVEAITCLTRAESGTIAVNGRQIQNTNPLNVLENKLSTIHEDRHRRGLVLDFSVAENLMLQKYRQRPYSQNGILDNGQIMDFSRNAIKSYDIRPAGCEQLPARSLSGGNQQKLIIARQIADDPDVLVAVQPTRGLDVGAIEYVHKMLIEQRDKGKAVLLISLELDEVMNVSDRIAVIYNGSIVQTFRQGEVDENTIGLLMAGGKHNGTNG